MEFLITVGIVNQHSDFSNIRQKLFTMPRRRRRLMRKFLSYRKLDFFRKTVAQRTEVKILWQNIVSHGLKNSEHIEPIKWVESPKRQNATISPNIVYLQRSLYQHEIDGKPVVPRTLQKNCNVNLLLSNFNSWPLWNSVVFSGKFRFSLVMHDGLVRVRNSEKWNSQFFVERHVNNIIGVTT